VDKEHQLDWMLAGGARDIGAMQPPDARAEGGRTAGRQRAMSGDLLEAGRKGAERARAIAEEWRARRG